MKDEEQRYKIVKLDKEYKNGNQKLVLQACFNASVMALMTLLILKQDANLTSTDINGLITSLEELVNGVDLPLFEPLKVVYASLFDGVKNVIDQLGILGVCLASKAVNFVIKITKGTVKQVRIKKELESLQKVNYNGGKENVR